MLEDVLLDLYGKVHETFLGFGPGHSGCLARAVGGPGRFCHRGALTCSAWMSEEGWATLSWRCRCSVEAVRDDGGRAYPQFIWWLSRVSPTSEGFDDPPAADSESRLNAAVQRMPIAAAESQDDELS